MKILDNSDKHLMPIIPAIVRDKLGKEIKALKFIGGGSFGRVYKATLNDGSTVAVKAYMVQGSQYTEAEQLRILAENTDVKMPEVLFTYEDEGAALLAMSFVDGKNVLNPVFLFKSKEQKRAFAEAVITGMLQWHSITNEKFGELSDAKYSTWREYYKAEKQQPILEALSALAERGKFPEKSLALLKKATEIYNGLPEEKCEAVLIHGDLNIMNIMADAKTFELTAFIDPCGSLWAERIYDLFQLRNMWGDAFGLYEEYKKRYPLSENADFCVAYYAAMHECSMRLKGALVMPLWEFLDLRNLKKEISRLAK